MYKLCFFVPASHLEPVKNALFAAGAGHFGDYDRCCWQTLGIGQFRPLPGSVPYSGRTGEVTQVEEYKVEMVCSASAIRPALTALLASHPYQQPAYEIHRLIDPDALPAAD